MTQTAAKYARALWEVNIPDEVIDQMLETYHQVPELKRVLEDPVVYAEKKYAVVDRIFPKQVQGFLKVLCKYGDMEYLEETIQAYKVYVNEHKRILNAQLRYVTAPNEEQLEGMRKFLCNKYHAQAVELDMEQDASLIGGFILLANGQEYDWSIRGRIQKMSEKLSRR